MSGPMKAQGVAFLFDPANARPIERDTFTCAHHNGIVMLHDTNGAKIPAVLCMQCDKRICVPCAERARCEPFERKLEAIEKQSAARSSLFNAMKG